MSLTTSVSLTDQELLVLDGKCSADVQKEIAKAVERIDLAKHLEGMAEGDVRFICRVLETAKEDKLLVCQGVHIRCCEVCKKILGYAKYKRSSANHRKGQDDLSRPLYLWGFELKKRFVSMRGYPSLGCCRDCMGRIRPTLAELLKNVRAEIPKELTGEPPRYRCQPNRRCTACGWTGHEGEMRLLPALMGGSYPGGCPRCPAKNSLFSSVIEPADGVTVVDAETGAPQ